MKNRLNNQYGNVENINLNKPIERFAKTISRKISLKSKVSQKDSLQVKSRKELNVYGKLALLAIYSTALVLIVLNRYQKIVELKFSKIEKNTLILKRQIGIIASRTPLPSLQRFKKDIDFEKVSNLVAMKIKGQNNYLENVLNTKNQEINELKNKLQEKFVLNKEQFDEKIVHKSYRKPASLPFSSKNLDVLRYRQGLDVETLKENLKRQRKLYVRFHDLTYSDEKNKFQAFLKNQKTALYELRASHREIRQKFRKNNYIIN